MTETSSELPQRLVVIGGRDYAKPWDPSCQACRSPHMRAIDSAIAEGYSLRAVRRLLSGLRPAVPNEEVLRRHIGHLAEPHLKSRLAFEEAAERRGDDTTTSSARMEDALGAIITRGRERIAHDDMDVSARDVIAAMRLQLQLERSREGEGVEASAWQAAFMEFFGIARRHMSREQWMAFSSEARSSPAILAVLAGEAPALPGGTGG